MSDITVTILKIILGAIKNIVFDESMRDTGKITALKFIIETHAYFIEPEK
jgi:hypothetical protein